MTRADAFVNFTFEVSLLAPVIAWYSFRLPRERHRVVQLVLLCTAWLAVLVLETRIRLEGGSGSFIAQAPVELRRIGRIVLGVHITGAVLSYAVWTGLAVVSWRRFRARLPGDFSRRHRFLGRAVFYGLCFDAVSAAAMYFIVFVAT